MRGGSPSNKMVFLVIAINFVEPKQPEPVVEVVEKIIEVPAKGLIAKVFSGIFG